ncbi:hypothetical protein RS130_18050 [Paraglaciecola aquimarina]|uniref:Uncharacterized protein n=1 Tax=Paraglaciecola aquimarina TaxID=1235557 RepID=A0ABU3T045_9ALTE|nr:hypothetical protein [Paraglaciecola aquimarina]MDU0355542.1 hypothetical protein [Paraglaciecola aquimarina]
MEKKIVDLSSQVDKLSKKSSKLKSKLHKERETGFSKKLAKLQADFDKRVAELTAVNQSPAAEPKQTVRAAVKRTVAKSPAAAKPRTAPAKPRVVKNQALRQSLVLAQ